MNQFYRPLQPMGPPYGPPPLDLWALLKAWFKRVSWLWKAGTSPQRKKVAPYYSVELPKDHKCAIVAIDISSAYPQIDTVTATIGPRPAGRRRPKPTKRKRTRTSPQRTRRTSRRPGTSRKRKSTWWRTS